MFSCTANTTVLQVTCKPTLAWGNVCIDDTIIYTVYNIHICVTLINKDYFL